MRRPHIIVGLAALAAVMVMAVPTASGSRDTPNRTLATITVTGGPSAGMILPFLARQKRYWRQAGLDVKPLISPSPTAATTAVASGAAQVAIAGAVTYWQAYNAGLPVTAITACCASRLGTTASPSTLPAPAPAEGTDIELVADLLGESWAARRPVILAGHGAVKAGARDELLRDRASYRCSESGTVASCLRW